MITLYQFKTSPFTEKVRRAMNFKGIQFDAIEVERAKASEGKYKDVSPTGKFPCIKDDEQAIWDSTDILHHIEGKYSNKPLIPTDPHEAAMAHVIEDWADESLYFYEMTMRLSWEHNLVNALDEFSETLPGVPKEQLKELVLAGVGQIVQAQGLGRKPQAQVVEDAERHIKALDAMLDGRDWLVGDALSYADLAVISQINAMLYAQEAEVALKKTKNVKPWMTRVDAIAPRGEY
ncbi:MAG: glutathione S-transferase family protein [Parvularculales bacterium]